MSTTIQEYSRTEAALAELRERYAKTTYDVTVASGMKAAKEARAVLRTWRTDLEKDRKRIKADALAHCQRVDAEARRITAEILVLEDPIDELIKTEERRKEEERRAAEELAAKKEAERLAVAKAAIDEIRLVVHRMTNKPSTAIAEKIKEIEAINTGGYALPEDAAAAKSDALGKLNDMWMAAIEQEAERKRLAEEREKLAAERAAMAAEQEQLAKERCEQAQRDAQAKAELDRQRAEVEKREAQAREELKRQEDARREIEKAAVEPCAESSEPCANCDEGFGPCQRVVSEESTTDEIDLFCAEGGDDGYETLVGPGGFRCILGEPEDRSFFRNLDGVVVKLNEQLSRIRELEAEVAKLRITQC